MPYRVARMALIGLFIVVPLLVPATALPASSGRLGGAWWETVPVLGAEIVALVVLLAADGVRRRRLAQSVRRIEGAPVHRVPRRPALMRRHPDVAHAGAADTW